MLARPLNVRISTVNMSWQACNQSLSNDVGMRHLMKHELLFCKHGYSFVSMLGPLPYAISQVAHMQTSKHTHMLVCMWQSFLKHYGI